MSVEKPITNDENEEQSTEEDERIKSYIRLILFALVVVIIWYGFDLASL